MAAGRDMNARLIIRLQDRFSAGLGGLQRRLEGIMGAMRRLSAVAAIGGGLALAGPIAQAAAFEDILRQSAITAGQTYVFPEAFLSNRPEMTSGEGGKIELVWMAGEPEELIDG